MQFLNDDFIQLKVKTNAFHTTALQQSPTKDIALQNIHKKNCSR